MEASVEYLRPIPDRLFFRIGDVADIIGVKPYVLRFWETEFPMIAPNKSAAGHRVYRRVDVEMVMLIKHLLYQQRYSIEGARKKIREMRKLGLLKESLAELAAKLPSEAAPVDVHAASAALVSSVSAVGGLDLSDDEIPSRPPAGARPTDLALAASLVRGENYLQSSLTAAKATVETVSVSIVTEPRQAAPVREIIPIPAEAFGIADELKRLADAHVSQFFRY